MRRCPPLIGALDPAPSPEVAALAEDASLELTRLDATLGGEVAAFAPLLLRSEAVASSRIENLTANARSVFSAELGDDRKRDATLIAANTRAMSAAIDLADELTCSSTNPSSTPRRPLPGSRSPRATSTPCSDGWSNPEC